MEKNQRELQKQSVFLNFLLSGFLILTVLLSSYPVKGKERLADNFKNSIVDKRLNYKLSKERGEDEVFKNSKQQQQNNDIGGTNWALGKPATASSKWSNDFPESNGNDGNINTMWSVASNSITGPVIGWWQVDLLEVREIDGFQLDPRYDFYQPVAALNLQIQGSNDPNFYTFEVLGERGSDPLDFGENWKVYLDDPVFYRYVRVTRTVTGGTFNMNEFKVVDLSNNEDPEPNPEPTPPGENLALNKPTSASSIWNNELNSSKGNDGNSNSFWSVASTSVTGEVKGWWQVDLGSKYVIDSIQLVPRPDLDQPSARSNFRLYGSNDPNFVSSYILYSQGNPFPHGTTLKETIQNINEFRYLRLGKLVTGGTFNFAEFRVYGSEPPIYDPNLNIVKDKPVTASSFLNEEFGPPNGNDGNLNTIWSNDTISDDETVTSWWQVDLQDEYQLSFIELVPRTDIYQPEATTWFDIRASNDPTFGTWSSLGARGDIPMPFGDTYKRTFNYPDDGSGYYRYIRITKQSSGSDFNFSEFIAHGTIKKLPEAPPHFGNVAYSKPTVASSELKSTGGIYTYFSQNGNDGGINTIWSVDSTSNTGQVNGWWQVDFLHIYQLDSLELIPRFNYSQPSPIRFVQVQASNDPIFNSYTVLADTGEEPISSGNSLKVSLSRDIHKFRYIRVARQVPGDPFNIAEFRAYGVIEETSPPPPGNIVLNKPAKSSSIWNENFNAQKGNDGSVSTIWSVNSTSVTGLVNGWWQVDLLETFEIDSLELVPRTDIEDAYAQFWIQIQGSNDPTFANFTVLAGIAEAPGSFGSTLKVDLPDKPKFRYLRVTKISPHWGLISFSELRAYGTPEGTSPTPGVNLALGKPSHSSSEWNNDLGAEKGNDNNTSNLWSVASTSITGEVPGWWQVDLLSAYKIDSVALFPRTNINQNSARSNFEVLGSNDSNFNTYQVLASQGNTPFAFGSTWKKNINNSDQFRYIRIRKTIGGGTFNFAEFKIYGIDNAQQTSSTPSLNSLRELVDIGKQDNAGFSIYPNPAEKNFSVQLPTDGSYRLELTDLQGKSILQKDYKINGNTSINVDVNSVESGVYILIVKGNGFVETEKIFINSN